MGRLAKRVPQRLRVNGATAASLQPLPGRAGRRSPPRRTHPAGAPRRGRGPRLSLSAAWSVRDRGLGAGNNHSDLAGDPPAARRQARRVVPRRTSSVGLGQFTADGRATLAAEGPSHRSEVSASRWEPRRRPLSAALRQARVERRATALPGGAVGNPPKQNRSTGRAGTARAMRTALGPRTHVTRDVGNDCRGDESIARVGLDGIPASVTGRARSPARSRSTRVGGPPRLVVLVIAEQTAGGQETPRRAAQRRRVRQGIFGSDDVRAGSSSASRGMHPLGSPIGVATRTSVGGILPGEAHSGGTVELRYGVAGYAAYHAPVTGPIGCATGWRAPIGNPLLGWLGPAAVAVLGGLLQFWQPRPPTSARVRRGRITSNRGISMLDYGVEMRWLGEGKIVDRCSHGNLSVFHADNGDMVVPPAGREVGHRLRRVDLGGPPGWGWRFSVHARDPLSILLIRRIARRYFSRVCWDDGRLPPGFRGPSLRQSRTGLLDLILMFWVLRCVRGAADRPGPGARSTLAQHVSPALHCTPTGNVGSRPRLPTVAVGRQVLPGLGDGHGGRACSSSSASDSPTVLWDMGACHRAAGVHHWVASTFSSKHTHRGESSWSGLTLATLSRVIGPDGSSARTATKRHWAGHPSQQPHLDPRRAAFAVELPRRAYHFHQTLTSPHDYAEQPLDVDGPGRPTSFFYEGQRRGHRLHRHQMLPKAVSSIGTIAIWWLATIGDLLPVTSSLGGPARLARGRHLYGLASGWLPWFDLQHRTIFRFYAVAFTGHGWSFLPSSCWDSSSARPPAAPGDNASACSASGPIAC